MCYWGGGAGSTKSLSVTINADVHLSAIDLGSVHHPAGLLCGLWRVKSHSTATLRPPVLHFDFREHYMTCRKQEPVMTECQN